MDASPSNPYAAPAAPDATAEVPLRIPLRNQQILRQAVLYSIFFFVGLACLMGAVAGISTVPDHLFEVAEDFTDVWLPELIFVMIPYLMIRSLTLGRMFRPNWLLYCIAGITTFPFLNFYSHLLYRDDTPLSLTIAAHLLSVVSAIFAELVAIAIFKMLLTRVAIAQTDA